MLTDQTSAPGCLSLCLTAAAVRIPFGHTPLICGPNYIFQIYIFLKLINNEKFIS